MDASGKYIFFGNIHHRTTNIQWKVSLVFNSMFELDVGCWLFDVPLILENEKSLSNLAVKQGQIGGWEFAILSFPCRH
jgi:hypothetical protein